MYGLIVKSNLFQITFEWRYMYIDRWIYGGAVRGLEYGGLKGIVTNGERTNVLKGFNE